MSRRSRGIFITFEGPDGAGKSTQVELLAQALAEREPLVFREPGGTELGERIREIVLHRPESMSAEAEMHLFMAARAELLRTRIEPALAAGRIVIDDRYQDSTLAYQGGGRGAPVDWPASFPKPDLTILLVLPPDVGLDASTPSRSTFIGRWRRRTIGWRRPIRTGSFASMREGRQRRSTRRCSVGSGASWLKARCGHQADHRRRPG